MNNPTLHSPMHCQVTQADTQAKIWHRVCLSNRTTFRLTDKENEALGGNWRLAQWRVTWLIEHSTSYQPLWCIDSFLLRSSPLRQAPKHWPNVAVNRIGIIICLVMSLLLFTGCASSDYLMAKAEVTLFGETYPPIEERTTLDVFMTNKPIQEYIEFALITCKASNYNWNLEQITKKALEIGADGIIIIGKAGSTGLGIPIGSTTFFFSEEYGMTAIAIKYK